MVIKSLTSATVVDSKQIATFWFAIKHKTVRKGFKKLTIPVTDEEGNYIVDKTKINIVLNSGMQFQMLSKDKKAGEEMFNLFLKAKQEDEK